MSAPFVFQLSPKQAKKLQEALESQEFSFAKPAHTLFQAKKKNLSVTLYESAKLVVQGKESLDFVTNFLEPEILENFSVGYEHLKADLTPRMGVDESGKGDFFGPLCIAAIFADGEQIQRLIKLGVKDSKKLSDKTIAQIAEKLRKEYQFHIVKIGPETYNELYDKFGNLNLLLGWGHATVIDNLLDKVKPEKIIIDQFAAEHVVVNALKKKKRHVELHQRTKAEEDLVVAAASILARDTFIKGLHALEKECGVKLPKGANAEVIAAGRKIVGKFGADFLKKMAKWHFKTREEILP